MSYPGGCQCHISIHSLRVEGDSITRHLVLGRLISIHSLRVEGDPSHDAGQNPARDFNPLPPCGGRPFGSSGLPFLSHFNPLPPCGGRLFCTHCTEAGGYFNPLPPCGGRPTIEQAFYAPPHFNPLPPCGGRQLAKVCRIQQSSFQSTPSVWRETEIFSFFLAQ